MMMMVTIFLECFGREVGEATTAEEDCHGYIYDTTSVEWKRWVFACSFHACLQQLRELARCFCLGVKTVGPRKV